MNRLASSVWWILTASAISFLILTFDPVYQGATISQANAVCQSWVGELAQGTSNHAASVCRNIAMAEDAKTLVLVIAVASAAWLVFGKKLRHG